MQKIVLSMVAVVTSTFLLAGCTQTPPEATNDAGLESEIMMVDEESQVDTVKEFTVEGNDFAFVPNSMTVQQGDTVRITFKNVEGFHDFVIDEFDVSTSQIGAGQTEVVEFVADQAGTFEYYCSVGQHRKMGMKGTLIVEDLAAL